MREMVPCGTPVSALMANCVQPDLTRAAIFSDVFMLSTIRKHIEKVNTHLHYTLGNNANMEFKDWLKAEMANRTPPMGPSDLARLTKIPQPTIFRILSGETKNPRIDKVKKIEGVLKAQSPPAEETEFQDILAAWRLLSPTQRRDMMIIMQQHIDHNQEVLAAFGGKKHKIATKRDPQIIDKTLPDFNEFTDFKDMREQDDRRRKKIKVEVDRRSAERRKNRETKT